MMTLTCTPRQNVYILSRGVSCLGGRQIHPHHNFVFFIHLLSVNDARVRSLHTSMTLIPFHDAYAPFANASDGACEF